MRMTEVVFVDGNVSEIAILNWLQNTDVYLSLVKFLTVCQI